MRMSVSELNKFLNRENNSQGAKYGSKKTNVYDSKKEAKRAQILKYEQRQGLIDNLEEHPLYELLPKQEGERRVTYTPDFRYMRDGELIVEDVKSVSTRKKESYIIKRKLMLWVHGIRVLET